MRLILALCFCFLSLGCSKSESPLTNPNTGSVPESSPRTYAPLEISNDAKLLLRIEYGGHYPSVIPGQYLGDSSQYFESRFIVHKGIPDFYDAHGGIRVKGGAFFAVADGFLAGRTHFTLDLFFVAEAIDGTLVGSNWATANDGDWLVQFHEGRLQLLMQYGGAGYAYQSTEQFETGRRYDLRVEKNGALIFVYIDGVPRITAPCPLNWLENGAPLSFGGNAYDRIDGMQYFNGTIGNVKIFADF
jgi:hypothetical protein